MKNVVIRVDASLYIGSGHIMRCLVLAESLVANGYTVVFCSRPQLGDLISYVRSKGFIVHELISSEYEVIPNSTDDYASWLQVPWQEDANSLLNEVNNADLLIVDHYGINANWENYVKNQLKCQVVVIDDLIRDHSADIIVDQTLFRTPCSYHNNNAIALTGCDYAMLKANFFDLRNKVFERADSICGSKVLVSMGGVDQKNVTLKVLHALSENTTFTSQITVLLGKKAPHYEEVKSFTDANAQWITHIDFSDNMASLIDLHDVAIGAPGSTSWERACLGVPSIIIPLAKNQEEICKQLTENGAALKLEIDEISSHLCNLLRTLFRDYEKMRKINLSLCDGLGVRRLQAYIDYLCCDSSNEIYLRKAVIDDTRKVYNWQKAPETRKYSLNANIPSWTEHRSWMIAKLRVHESYFYMIEFSDFAAQIGVVRLDKLPNDNYLISIFVAPQYYGRGIAKKTLSFIDKLHPNLTIEATVLEDNIASQKLFKSAKYYQLEADKFIRYPIIRENNENVYRN